MRVAQLSLKRVVNWWGGGPGASGNKSNARSRRPFSPVPVLAAMASRRSAVAGDFLDLAVPRVRRMPRTVAFTLSSSVGV